MIRSRLTLLVAILFAALGRAAESLPGDSLAIIAAARNDWFDEVQANVKRARQGGIDLLFLGDSITHAWCDVTGSEVWQKYYASGNAAAFGIGGDRTENLLWRVSHGELAGISPKVIVVLIGTNNVRRDSASQIAEGVAAVLREVRQRCPRSHVLLLGLFPRGEKPEDPLRAKVREVNERIALLGNDAVTFLNLTQNFLSEDGTLSREVMHDFLHLTPRGFETWAEAINPQVERWLRLPRN